MTFLLPSQPLETVIVKIGKEKVSFTLYKAFLIHYSLYFEKALTGNFKEASTGIIHLEHTTAEVSGLCMEWIMTQQIQDTHITKELPMSYLERIAEEKLQPRDLIKLWILADYLRIPDLQNKTIDILAAKLVRLNVVSAAYYNLVYKPTLPGSMLREFHVDSWCWVGIALNLQEHEASMPREIVVNIAVVLQSRIMDPTKPNPLLNSKIYHVAAMP